MAGTPLPPGFRFHPTDVELVKYYLKRKVMGKKLASNVIAEVDVYKNEPWDLPDKSYLPSRDLKWYFYCPREKKYSSGLRINRATECGYWKTTGKDRPVLYNAKTVGMIKTLIYHLGRAPKGNRTDWVMHEYRLDDKDLADGGVVQDAFVLCMIFQKEGPGPRNGAQYGAPFKEDDWSDDEENNGVGVGVGVGKALSESQPAPVLLLPSQSDSAVTTGPVSESNCVASTSDCRRSEILPSVEKFLPVAANNYSSTLDFSQIQEDGDFLSMQDLVQEPTEKNENKLNNSNQEKDVVPACTDGSEIFEDLGDLWSWFGRNENGTHFAGDGDAAYYSMDQIWAATSAADPGAFILLSDLDTPLNGSGPSNAP